MKMNQGQKTLKDIMTRGIITISAQSSISEIADTLARNNISSAPIVTINGETMGIVSEMDVLKAMGKPEWMKYDAECIMSHSVISAPASTTIDEAARIMVDKKIHQLLVLSEKGIGGMRKPIGIVSAGDLIKKAAS